MHFNQLIQFIKYCSFLQNCKVPSSFGRRCVLLRVGECVCTSAWCLHEWEWGREQHFIESYGTYELYTYDLKVSFLWILKLIHSEWILWLSGFYFSIGFKLPIKNLWYKTAKVNIKHIQYIQIGFNANEPCCWSICVCPSMCAHTYSCEYIYSSYQPSLITDIGELFWTHHNRNCVCDAIVLKQLHKL